jgi:thymidine kinase
VGLRNKEYHILNKKVSKEQFLKYKSYILSSKKNRDNFLELFYELKKSVPVKCIIIDESQNCY